MATVRFPRLTREGWYFLIVLCFVVVGAVARQLNLLVLLAGMMIGPLVLHGHWVARTLRHLHVRRRLPRRVYSGEPVHVGIVVRNEAKRTGAWLLQAEDRLEPVAGPMAGTAAVTVPIAIPLVQPQDEALVSYRTHFLRRGEYRFGPLTVTTQFPLGLLQSARIYPVSDTVLVLPRLGRMTAEWRRLVLGEWTGVQATVSRQGLTEADYYGLREWRAGDSVRWIHWRTTARLAALMVRQFERQRNFSVALLVDLWLPAHPTDDDLQRVELAVSFAATAISDLAHCGGGWLAVGVAGSKSCCHAGQTTSHFIDEVIACLALESGGDGHVRPVVASLWQLRQPGIAGVIVSTRPDIRHQWERSLQLTSEQIAFLRSMAWIDVGSPKIQRFFLWHKSPHGPATVPDGRTPSKATGPAQFLRGDA